MGKSDPFSIRLPQELYDEVFGVIGATGGEITRSDFCQCPPHYPNRQQVPAGWSDTKIVFLFLSLPWLALSTMSLCSAYKRLVAITAFRLREYNAMLLRASLGLIVNDLARDMLSSHSWKTVCVFTNK